MTQPYPWPSNLSPDHERARLEAAIAKKKTRKDKAESESKRLGDEIEACEQKLLDVAKWERSRGQRHDPLDEGGEFSRFAILLGLSWAAWRGRNISVLLGRLTGPDQRESARQECLRLDDDACTRRVVEETPLLDQETRALVNEVILDVSSELAACRALLKQGREQGGDCLRMAEKAIRSKLGRDPQLDWKKDSQEDSRQGPDKAYPITFAKDFGV